MSEQPETNQQVIRIGSDQVTITNDEVVIEAKHETAGWEVRTNNAPAIYFRENKYLLVEKGQAQPPFKIRYVLRPWPPGKIQNPKLFLNYGEDSVAERDSSRRGEAFNSVVWVCLLPLYPFLGLLWSGTQQRLVRFGYVPRTITGLSIFTSFAMMLAKKREFPLAQVYGLLEPGPVVLVTTARAGRANHVKGRAPHVANIMPMSWHTMMEFVPPLVGCVISSLNYTRLRFAGDR
jgi:hypothetical protein